MLQYSLVRNGDTETLVVQLDELTTISSAHANFERVKQYLIGGGGDPEEVRRLLDVRSFVSRGLTRLSDRVTFDGEQIRFDGDVVDTVLSRHIIRLLREGDAGLRPAVLFMEHLAQNPSALSRMHLWKWLNARQFSLTPEGHIIGYKAVQDTDDNLSITSGRNEVVVNGRIYTGHVPNPIGADVSIRRSEVNPNRDDGCSAGLHVGTWDYAESFAGARGKVLTVSVNPRDVVAVPRDCAYQKMRVCRYTVLAVTEAQHTTALVGDYVFADDVDEDAEVSLSM